MCMRGALVMDAVRMRGGLVDNIECDRAGDAVSASPKKVAWGHYSPALYTVVECGIRSGVRWMIRIKEAGNKARIRPHQRNYLRAIFAKFERSSKQRPE